MLRTIWSELIVPIFRRPSNFQVAALCYRRDVDRLEILLVTSLETRRWILPKGWPKPGLSAGRVAAEEAWEEAGVRPCAGPARKIGRYRYEKRVGGGIPSPTVVDVFAIEVEALDDAYPEAGRRERRWVSASEAMRTVSDPELRPLLQDVEALLDPPERV